MRTGILATLATASLAVAAPLAKRNNTGTPAKENIDVAVLNFALTLEHLEAAFYKQGLEKYSADAFMSADFPEWVRYRLTEVASHEKIHVDFLTGALEAAGATATQACSYSFPDTSPASFIAVAQQLEGVGVSAYAGAARLITNPDYLTYAADVLAVEARHSAWIRGAAQNGDSFPQAFDTDLGINEVYSLAAQFITECPSSNPALPVKAFPVLTASALEDGMTTLSYDGDVSGKFALFLTATGQTAVEVGSDGKVMVPEGMYGQQYVILASKNAALSDDIVVAGPAIVEVPFQATTVPY